MDYWGITCMTVFLISFILTGIIIPQILLIAFRKNLFDLPDTRKVHNGIVPRLGGIAFMPSIFFSIAATIGISMLYNSPAISEAFVGDTIQIAFGSCAMILMFLVGVADDLIGVRYRAKFIVQIIAAIFFVAAGICIFNLHGFLGVFEIPDYISWILTIIVIVFITNAINLIDGIDGLASGLSAVGLLFYGIIFYIFGFYPYAIITFATFGTLVPFFYYNVFGNPNHQKKIFMGDTGTLTIGILLSYLSIAVNSQDLGEQEQINPIVVAFSPLILPCFDVIRVYFHRIRRHRNPFLPDQCHIHHKLLALGLPARVVMLLILMASISFVVMNMLVSPYIDLTILVLLNICLYLLGNVLLTKAIRNRERRLNLTENLYD